MGPRVVRKTGKAISHSFDIEVLMVKHEHFQVGTIGHPPGPPLLPKNLNTRLSTSYSLGVYLYICVREALHV